MTSTGYLITRCKAFVVLAICSIASVSLAQATTLEDVSFTSLPGNEFEVTLEFSEAPPNPESYSIEVPARIVFDFPGVESQLQKKKHDLSYENAQSAVVLTSGDKTRFVLNLDKLLAFTSSVQGNKFVLRVGENSVQQGRASESANYSNFDEPTVSTTPPLARSVTDLDFSRGGSGEGLITLALSDPKISADVQQSGSTIELKFFNTELPKVLDRRLDVIDFATPVASVDAVQEGTTTKVKIDIAGDYDFLVYQADSQYVVSVKPLTEKELEEKRAKFAFVGEKLSLNFQDIAVRSVLQVIADFTDMNLVASDSVGGNITLRLKNVPWDQALEIVLKAKGLDKRLDGNVLMVAPAAEIAERERLQVEANKQLEELAPLVTEFIRVKYADAATLYRLFDPEDNTRGDGTATRSMLTSRGSASVDQRTNTIILTDTEDKVREFRRLIDQIDIPVRQVEISARIVSASTDFTKELGVRWGVQGALDLGGVNAIGVTGALDGLSDPTNPLGTFPLEGGGGVFPGSDQVLVGGDGLNVDLGVSNPAGQLTLGLLTNDLFLDLELSALENEGFAEVASQPKILTGDKQKATIRSGQEVAYQAVGEQGANIEFKEAVLMLDVTPQITPDNRVILKLFISQNSVAGVAINNQPVLDITDITTTALVGDGQTLVLGGIFQYSDISGEEKVPFLGDLPYIGRAFKKNINTSEKREILIFITPKIIDDQLIDR